MYDRIQYLPFTYHDHTTTGQLINRCIEDVRSVQSFAGESIVEIVQLGIVALGVVTILVLRNPVLALVSPLFGGRRVMFPIPPKHSRDEVSGTREMLASGAFTPVVDRRYPLDAIVDAYRYVETGEKIGNVVIDVVPPD